MQLFLSEGLRFAAPYGRAPLTHKHHVAIPSLRMMNAKPLATETSCNKEKNIYLPELVSKSQKEETSMDTSHMRFFARW